MGGRKRRPKTEGRGRFSRYDEQPPNPALRADYVIEEGDMLNKRIDHQAGERLRRLGVSLVYCFGSTAEGAEHGLSDLDIGIVLQAPRRLEEDSFSLYNELYDILTEVFSPREVDIVFVQAAGLEVCSDAVRHGRLLFAASKDARYEFEERTTILYADFKPLLDRFNQAVLERI